uniref:Dimethylargininase n=1 Tax=Clytia hemisphaerica TaxID=252671 RepID=A0A7M5XDK3_9CNID|eukprot:TCONS_00015860-protein
MVFKYTKAVCRRIPKSIVDDGIRMDLNEPLIDYKRAVQQHEHMVQSLEKLGVKVTVLETDESTPDCVFVEDPAVIIGDTVLITNPGRKSRKPETKKIKEHFKKNEPHLKIVEMESPAELDGGDVMFTGREIFVGQSRRTNKAGYLKVKETFPDYPVHAIPIPENTLHLLSCMSAVDEDTIICGGSPDASAALKVVLEKTTCLYSVIRTPDDDGANLVSVNGTILWRSDLPATSNIISKLNIPKMDIDGSELNKVDGSLTCCSLLYN